MLSMMAGATYANQKKKVVAPAGFKPVIASYYHLPGNRTASGSMYSNNRSCFASRHLSFGTRADFIYRNPKTGVVKTVKGAVCNDRGPFVRGRDVDLNNKLRKSLGFNGVGTVYIKIVKPTVKTKKSVKKKEERI